MIVKVTLDYPADEKIKALSAEDHEALRLAVPEMELQPRRENSSYEFFERKFLATEEHLMALERAGLKYEIRPFKGMIMSSQQIAGQTTNIQIAIPNIGLLSINEVTWEEDCCTEQLQDKLDTGWRILAVCPPNNERRPTYILGRTKND